ncbi:MAG: lytic transglycosylase domain-containing protein [Bacteroidota bacterium]
MIKKIKITSAFLLVLFLNGCKDDSPEKNDQLNNQIIQPTIPSIPKSMLFFGKKINLEDEDIRERLDREIITNVYFQSSTTFALKRANRYFPEIERILDEETVPEDFKYLAVIESNLSEVTSPVGANGFWQFMPFTAKEYNLIINDEVDERLNLTKSTHAACAFIKNAHEIFGDWVNACASYNRGIGGVQSDMKWQKTDHYFDTDMNNETGRYVFRIMAMKLIMENPKSYGFDIPNSQLYNPLKTKTIKSDREISNLAEWAKNRGINLKILRKLNPWLISNKLTTRPSDFSIKLPLKNENLKNFKSYN